MRLRRAARVILIGPPGVGKGTQTERLLERFKELQSFSTGDLLRHNVKKRTALGIMAENTLKTGGLVADELILRLISNELYTRGWLASRIRPALYTLATSSQASVEAYPFGEASLMDSFIAGPVSQHGTAAAGPSNDPSASFILDGFPRTTKQAQALDGLIPINLAVVIKTPFDVILQRIAGRWVHERSGRIYNTTFHAPKVPGRDDITGECLVQRPDDNDDVYRARLRHFTQTSEPLMEHYAKKGVLWEVEGMSSDEITPKLITEFERRFVF